MKDDKLIELFRAIERHEIEYLGSMHRVHLTRLIELARAGVAARAKAAMEAGDFS